MTHYLLKKSIITLTCMVALSGCNMPERLANVGKAPDLAAIEDPTVQPGYRPVSLPMPAPVAVKREANSLWQSGSRSFFKDQRASQVGDLISVSIAINDDAQLNNTSTRKRTNTEDAGLDSLFGYELSLGDVLPEAVDNTALVGLESNLSNSGTGTIDRDEKINLKVAAIVTQVLPNGNMVIHGRQEVRVNYEVRELQMAGIIRPEDIDSQNTIDFDKVAEARIAYGGRGQITDVQQPRYGQQVLDIIMPF